MKFSLSPTMASAQRSDDKTVKFHRARAGANLEHPKRCFLVNFFLWWIASIFDSSNSRSMSWAPMGISAYLGSHGLPKPCLPGLGVETCLVFNLDRLSPCDIELVLSAHAQFPSGRPRLYPRDGLIAQQRLRRRISLKLHAASRLSTSILPPFALLPRQLADKI